MRILSAERPGGGRGPLPRGLRRAGAATSEFAGRLSPPATSGSSPASARRSRPRPAQQARQLDIFSRSDSLILSTMHVETELPGETRAFRWCCRSAPGPSACCSTPQLARPTRPASTHSEIVPGDAEAIGTAHGITLMSESSHHKGVGHDLARCLDGAWLVRAQQPAPSWRGGRDRCPGRDGPGQTSPTAR